MLLGVPLGSGPAGGEGSGWSKTSVIIPYPELGGWGGREASLPPPPCLLWFGRHIEATESSPGMYLSSSRSAPWLSLLFWGIPRKGQLGRTGTHVWHGLLSQGSSSFASKTCGDNILIMGPLGGYRNRPAELPLKWGQCRVSASSPLAVLARGQAASFSGPPGFSCFQVRMGFCGPEIPQSPDGERTKVQSSGSPQGSFILWYPWTQLFWLGVSPRGQEARADPGHCSSSEKKQQNSLVLPYLL